MRKVFDNITFDKFTNNYSHVDAVLYYIWTGTMQR